MTKVKTDFDTMQVRYTLLTQDYNQAFSFMAPQQPQQQGQQGGQ